MKKSNKYDVSHCKNTYEHNTLDLQSVHLVGGLHESLHICQTSFK